MQRTPLYTNNVLQSFANGDQRSKLVYKDQFDICRCPSQGQWSVVMIAVTTVAAHHMLDAGLDDVD